MTKKTAIPTPPAVPVIPSVLESTTPVIPVTETLPTPPPVMTEPVEPLELTETVTPPAVPEPESYPDDLEDGQLRVRHKTNRQVFVVAQDYYDIHQGVLELVQ